MSTAVPFYVSAQQDDGRIVVTLTHHLLKDGQTVHLQATDEFGEDREIYTPLFCEILQGIRATYGVTAVCVTKGSLSFQGTGLNLAQISQMVTDRAARAGHVRESRTIQTVCTVR